MTPLSREKIDEFKLDVAALGWPHAIIAKKMGLHKSNFSNYHHEKHSITKNFLKKFYDAWGEELNKTVAQENVGFYPKMNYREDNIHALQKNNDALLSMLEKVIEGNSKLGNSNNQLAESTAILVSNNEKLIEIQNALLDKQTEILDILKSKLQA